MPLRRLTLPERYDLTSSFRALYMKSAGRVVVDDDRIWRATRTPEGPGTISLARSGAVLLAEAWGPGADWLLETAPDLLGLRDDPGALVTHSGIVHELNRRQPGLRLGRTLRPFDVVMVAILGQRVTGRQAANAYRRLVGAYGEDAPGPHPLSLPPSPAQLASLGYEDYHRFGVERVRASALIEAARRVKRIEEINEMPRAAALRRLLAIRGIGPWTAASVMGIAWGDQDAVQTGDYHLPNTVAWALAGEARAEDARMLELLEPYAGQRRRVIVLIKGSGLRPPKYGPRTAMSAIEAI